MCVHENSRELSMENLLEWWVNRELEFQLHTKECDDGAWNFESYQLEGLVNTSSFPLKPWRGYSSGEKTVSGISSLDVLFIKNKT